MQINNLEHRPLRSQPTRDRILEAARAVFARQGYDNATIRAIAAAANINPAMVMRYYGSKERLFATAMEFKPVAPEQFAGVPLAHLGEAIVERIVTAWRDPAHRNIRRAMLLTSFTSMDARQRYGEPFAEAYRNVFRQYGNFRNLEAVVALVGSQIVGLLSSRYIFETPRLVAMPDADLIRDLGAAMQVCIDRLE